LRRDLEREEIDALMSSFARADLGKDDDDAPDEFQDWKLHYPLDFALQSWNMLRQHGIMPEPGGLLDQAPDWLADMRTLNARYNAAIKRESDDDSGDLRDALDEDAPDVADML